MVDIDKSHSQCSADSETARDGMRAMAEIAIQKILVGLENDTGQRLGQVEVDTRNFASCNVEIFFESETAR